MEQRGVVEVGDELITTDGQTVIIERVERGSHGLLLCGKVPALDDLWVRVFLPDELAPVSEIIWHWQGWLARQTVVLVNGVSVGGVCQGREASPMTIQSCDAEWQRTLDEWQPEAMQSKPLPVGENVARMD